MRETWLICGIVLLLLLGFEAAYRVQATIRGRLRAIWQGPAEPEHPNRGRSWWAEWEAKAGAINGPSRYDPYRGWWALPYNSRYVNVDSDGRRVTVNPELAPGARLIYMLGGSVMWGYTARDSFTIPSLVARRLAEAHVGPVEVVNLAQPSYNTTQGVITLLLELRAGRTPAVVVSLDGNNDVLAAVRDGMPGAMLGEGAAARQSAVGWRGFLANLAGLIRFSALGDRLLRAMRPPRVGRDIVFETVPDCHEIAGQYRRLHQAAEGLGRAFGFKILYAWQPHWVTTAKRLTPWEQGLTGEGVFPALMRRCTATIDSVMADRVGRTFVSLTSLFDADTESVFLDEFGHMTEVGNGRVADKIAALVAPLLGRPSERR